MGTDQLQVQVSGIFDHAASSVWGLLGAWDGLAAYAGGVVSCEADGNGAGAIRHVTLADATRFAERLVDIDAAAMTYSYEFVEAPAGFPIVDYVARVTVAAVDEDQCRTTWEGFFRSREGATDAEAVAFVRNAYEANLEGLRSILQTRER